MATKKRNYYVDLFKVYAGMILMGTHIANHIVGVKAWYNGLWGEMQVLDEAIFFKGISTLGIFLFTTGYWLMHAFQSYKQKGLLRRGHDFEVAYRLTTKNYSAYIPVVAVANFIGFLYAHWTIGFNFKNMVLNFLWNIPQFLGMQSFAFHGTTGKWIMYDLVSGVPFAPTDYISFQDTMWYITGMIAFCSFFYVMLVISEKFTMFFMVPFVFILGNLTTDAGITGFGAIFPYTFARLWNLAVIGMVGWYVVEGLKKIEWTEKRKKIVGWLHLVLFILMNAMFIFGMPGGMFIFDSVALSALALAIVNQDWFAVGVNNFLDKIPVSKYLGDLGLGLIALQQISLIEGKKLYATGEYSVTEICWISFGINFALAIAWVIISQFTVKPMTKGLVKVFGLSKPFGSMKVIEDAETINSRIDAK